MTVAAIVETYGQPQGEPIRYTVADTLGIEKGTLMALSGATVRAAKANGSGNGETFVGIASTEKVANDGSTSMGCWTKGVFDIICSGDVIAGEVVQMSGANQVALLEGASLSGQAVIVGTALETGTDGNPMQVILRQ